MPSIYDLIRLDDDPPAPTPDRVPMPLQLSMLGCGRHTFARDSQETYWCVACGLKVHPGQLMYGALRTWMGDS